MGLTQEDVANDRVIEVWPEHWDAFQLFSMLRTQWRVGAKGPTGLDYGVVFSCMDTLRIKRRARIEMLDDIRVMEREALDQMYKK